MSENQKQTPNAVDLMSAMVENQKSMAEAIKQQGEHFKSFVVSQAEVKSVKEDYEAKSKAEEAEKKSILERLDSAEKKSAILEAEVAEVKSKKTPVHIGGATQVDNFNSLQYQVKSNAITALTQNIDGLTKESNYKQAVEYVQSFAKENKSFSSRLGFDEIMEELQSKSASHGITDMSMILNAPFILPALIHAEKESAMRRVATLGLANTIEIKLPVFSNIGQAEHISPTTQSLTPAKTAVLNTKTVKAVRVAQAVKIDDYLTAASSVNISTVINYVQTVLRENVIKLFDADYSGEGVQIIGGGSIEGIVPHIDNQYQYDINDSRGSNQVQIGKLAFIKSGHASDITIDVARIMKDRLPQGTRLQFMGNSTMVEKFKGLRDNGSLIYFNGNGQAIVDGMPDRQLGFELIVNNDMQNDVAVFGDITNSYKITDCLGGFQIFNRPATGMDLSDGLIASMYSTGCITNYQKIRLLKIGA